MKPSGLPSDALISCNVVLHAENEQSTASSYDGPMNSPSNDDLDNILFVDTAHSLPYTKYELPRMEINNLSRLKWDLSTDGKLIQAEERILQVQEYDLNHHANSILPPPTLTTIGKCKRSDPCPLMPSAVLRTHDQYPEPIRHRDEDWFQDCHHLLGDEIDTSVGIIRAKKQKKRKSTKQMVSYLALGAYPPMGKYSRKQIWLPEISSMVPSQMLWRGAMTISQTRCIMTVFGLGIAGRAFAEGIHNPRYVLIEAYDQEKCMVSKLLVSMQRLKELFYNFPELLQAGRKRRMVIELCKLCYFEYSNIPDKENPKSSTTEKSQDSIESVNEAAPNTLDNDRKESHNTTDKDSLEYNTNFNHKFLRLCISPGQKVNEEVKTRRKRLKKKREESVQVDEAAQLAYAALPKRKRDLVYVGCLQLSGWYFVCMVYVFKENPSIFVIRYYRPCTSEIYEINLDIAALTKASGKMNPSREESIQILRSFLLQDTTQCPIHKLGRMELNINSDSGSLMAQLAWCAGTASKSSWGQPIYRSHLSFKKKRWMMEQLDITHHDKYGAAVNSDFSKTADKVPLRYFKNKHRKKVETSVELESYGRSIVEHALSASSLGKECTWWQSIAYVVPTSKINRPTTFLSSMSFFRRDTGRGEKLASGSAKVQKTIFTFTLYRKSTSTSSSLYDGNDSFELDLYSPYEFGGNNANITLQFLLDMNDLYRICRGTKMLEIALKQDSDEYIKSLLKKYEKLEKIQKKESETLNTLVLKLKELEKQEYSQEIHKQAINDCCSRVEALRNDRDIVRGDITKQIIKKRSAWIKVCKETISRCSLYMLWFNEDEKVLVDGEFGRRSCIISGMLANLVSEHNSFRKQKCTIKLDCVVYRSDHLISPADDNAASKDRLFAVSAIQEGERLRFIARDINTGEYCTFSNDNDEEQKMFVESMKRLTKEEVQIQIAESLSFLEYYYENIEESDGTQKSFIKIIFGEPKDSAFDVHVSEEELKKAEDYMDDIMALNVQKAKHRERAATKRIVI